MFSDNTPLPLVDTDGRPIKRTEYTAAEIVRVRDVLAKLLDIGGAPQRKAEALMLADVIDMEAALAMDNLPEMPAFITERERQAYAAYEEASDAKGYHTVGLAEFVTNRRTATERFNER